MAFTITAVLCESEIVEENPSDRELFENADLQEAYNKLCKRLTTSFARLQQMMP